MLTPKSAASRQAANAEGMPTSGWLNDQAGSGPLRAVSVSTARTMKAATTGTNTLTRVEVAGAVFGSALGSILHFTYAWSGSARPVALFSAVNESPWEHLKLYLYPVLLYAAVEWFSVGDLRRLLFAKLVQQVAGLLFILAFFYTYTGALGIENVILDILSFVVAMALGYWLSHRLLLSSRPPPLTASISALALAAIVVFFCIATFNPPHLPLFFDRNGPRYGIG